MMTPDPARERPPVPAATDLNQSLLALWNRVVETRQTVADQRNLPQSATSVVARADLLTALEAYTHGLVQHGRPVPPSLRDELRLRQLACSADRGHRGTRPIRRLT